MAVEANGPDDDRRAAKSQCRTCPSHAGGRAAAAPSSRPPEPETPNVEIIEAAGLRWINIERPRAVDRAWLEEHFEFHPLDYEDVYSRNQRPKVDEYDDYLFVVLHFPRVRQARSAG